MNLAELRAKLDRVQHGRTFKIVATIIVVACAIAFLATYVLGQAQAGAFGGGPDGAAPANVAGPTPGGEPLSEAEETARTAIEATRRSIEEITSLRTDWTALAIGVAIATGLALVIIWLGLGLTYLGLGIFAGIVAGPLLLLDRARIPFLNIQCRSAGLFTLAMVLLGGAFTALVQSARLIFSSHWATLASGAATATLVVGLAWIAAQVGLMPPGAQGPLIFGIIAVALGCTVAIVVSRAAPPPGQTFAIARLVVDEAVRMKVSLVFMVLLMVALAALPGALNPDTPLRYRVQSFLQYGSSVSYWLIGFLVVFLAVGTVAFEQRDRVIWQTMTKPVATWRYILGKWVGVMGVAAVLFGVSMSGVFLFTEYLRQQPAQGEFEAYVPLDENIAVTEDRLYLETQVLSSRRSVGPTVVAIDEEELEKIVDQIMRDEANRGPTLTSAPRSREQIAAERREAFDRAYFSIGPEDQQLETYYFNGLDEARALGKPMSLRFKGQFGANDPRSEYTLTFFFSPSLPPVMRRVSADQTFTVPITPAAVNPDGTLALTIFNGRLMRDGSRVPNAESVGFLPGSLEVFYPGDSYRLNFARSAIILLAKLGVMAMIGIFAGTFLSFPVAAMVAMGFFLGAESSGFMWDSLTYYSPTNAKGEVLWHRVVADFVTRPIAATLKVFSDIDPIERLVDGRVVSWATIAFSVTVTSLVSAGAYACAVFAMRRRELAIYSGH